MEIIGDYGKKYKNGTEYALDRNRYNKPVDPVTKKKVLSILRLVGMIGLAL